MDSLEKGLIEPIENQFIPLQNDDFVIDVKGLFYALCKKWWLFMIVAVLGGVAGYITVKEPVTTSYSMNITMCVTPKPIEDKQFSVTDVTSANKLIPTYIELIEKSQMLEAIAVASNTGYDGEKIEEMLSIYSVEDTNIFDIIIKGDKEEDVRKVIDAIIQVVPESLMELLPVGEIGIANMSTLNSSVKTKSPIKNAIIGGILGVVLVAGIICVLELLKNPIRNEKDLEKAFGITSLGSVPQFKVSNRNMRKLRKKRSNSITAQNSR